MATAEAQEEAAVNSDGRRRREAAAAAAGTSSRASGRSEEEHMRSVGEWSRRQPVQRCGEDGRWPSSGRWPLWKRRRGSRCDGSGIYGRNGSNDCGRDRDGAMPPSVWTWTGRMPRSLARKKAQLLVRPPPLRTRALRRRSSAAALVGQGGARSCRVRSSWLRIPGVQVRRS